MPGDEPAVIFGVEHAIDDPTPAKVAQILGMDLSLCEHEVVDLLIVGGGPSGVAAGVYAGAGWFAALIAAVRAAHPGIEVQATLDCGAGFGAVLAALRAGHKHLIFTGPPDQAATLTALAAAQNATIACSRPPSLDLRPCRDKVTACRVWLADGRLPA